MNITQQGMVMLLKSAVTQSALPLPAEFDLEAAAILARRHHMIPLIWSGALHCGISSRHPVMNSFFLPYCKALQISERQLKELNRIYAAFETHGIDYLPLKGCRMKSLYPAPELRIMGDADILIRQEQYGRIRDIMAALSFEEKGETSHEYVWQSAGLCLELHKQLMPSGSRIFYRYFRDIWDRAVPVQGTCYAMKKEEEFLFLFVHFTKHYLDGGVGCRHVVDLWVYRRKNPDLDEACIRTELGKIHLLEFYCHVCKLLAVWFEEQETDARTEAMTAFLFDNGSWGSIGEKAISRLARDGGSSRGMAGKRLAYFWKNAFPSRDVLQGRYPVLNKRPWMLPGVWALRLGRELLKERKTVDLQKAVFYDVTEENVQQRRRMLKDVGLDWDF